MTRPLKVFCDFDGTITRVDGCNLIIDHCIGRDARRAIDDKIVSGELSFRQGYDAQFSGVNLTWEESLPILHGKNGIDPTFPPFVRRLAQRNIPLTILSAGIEQIIREYLGTVGLTGLDIRANRIRVENRRWRVAYFDETPFGNDKAAAVREAAAQGFRTVFIGDGISDFPVASVADILFAKRGNRLEEHCLSQGIAFHPFDDFDEIGNRLLEIGDWRMSE